MDLSVVPLNESSSFHELLTLLTAALGCGLLIGLERERHKQREEQASFAGLRSFAICALLGALCFYSEWQWVWPVHSLLAVLSFFY